MYAGDNETRGKKSKSEKTVFHFPREVDYKSLAAACSPVNVVTCSSSADSSFEVF